MKIIIRINTQEEFNALPGEFKDTTVIEIYVPNIVIQNNIKNGTYTLRGNSSAVLWGNSSAELRDNSSAELWGNSSAELYYNSSAVLRGNSSAVLWGNSSAVLRDNSSAVLYYNSSAVLWDNSSAVLWGNSSAVLFDNSIGRILNPSVRIDIAIDSSLIYSHVSSFSRGHIKNEIVFTKEQCSTKEALKHGYLRADGITKEIKARKSIGGLEIFELEDGTFCVRKGDKYSHGETLKEAKEDLIYKILDRDTTEYKSWTIATKATKEQMIEAYRKITGACGAGVRSFVESSNIPDELTVQDVIKKTDGRYGHEEFRRFFVSSN